MNSPYTYADVVLPLRVPAFTYKIPEALRGVLRPGHRVVVQFGQKKLYTAIVMALHHNPPEIGTIKTIRSIAEQEPIVTEKQLAFWKWMADYYMCTIGEVIQAALPSAFKLDSQALIAMRPDWEEGDTELSTEEFIVVETLRHEGTLSIQKLAVKTEVGKLHRILNSLIGKEVVYMEQELKERYKVRTETHIELARDNSDEELNILLDELSRSPKQQHTLLTFLHLKEEQESILKADLITAAAISPAPLKGLLDKGILKAVEVAVDRLEKYTGPVLEYHELSPAQTKAKEEVEQAFEEHNICLLHGVTGSGKTHIYFELIEKTISEGKQVLYLLPEIALTGQIIERMRKYFGDQVGIYHSKFSDQERVEIWHKVRHGEYKIVLGARSSLFMPFQDLGLLIVDEEHDQSFKQFDPAPRYNARDSALYLSAQFGAKALLGTATPSLESWFNAQTHKYGYVYLAERHKGVKLPTIEVVDVKRHIKRKEMKSHFSPPLLDAMKLALDRNEQVILFQNKRGFAPYLICTNCSWIPKCKHCDVSLTYHKFSENMRCHYCGYSVPVMDDCEVCHQQSMKLQGFGTEKIEEELSIFFPTANIGRMDQDSTRSKEGHTHILNSFRNHELDILVGTQMVTKGLDFEKVSLVGVLSADQLLSYPDHRANERAFQLMEQVSGRAGRHQLPGKVLIQAMDPENEVIQAVVQNEWKELYKNELYIRRQFQYPPYHRLIQITVKHRERPLAIQAARTLADLIRPKLIAGKLLGPTSPLIGRIKGLYLQDILVKIPRDKGGLLNDKAVINWAIEALKKNAELKSAQVHLNVDP